MSRIGGKDTAPEILVRKIVHSLGFRFRLHRTDLPGKPDVVLPRHRKIIFIHGCFWHGHPRCRRAALPRTNAKFWKSKIGKNVRRDKRVRAELADLGWEILVLWQCELRDAEKLKRRLTLFLGLREANEPSTHQLQENNR